MKRLVILISNKGTGTNLQAIINGVNSKKINAKIVAVISDTPEALGLDRARRNNLPIIIVTKKEELLNTLKKLDPDYICLGGWKQIILDEVINEYPNKILNVHPGLIPDTLDGVVKNPDGTNGIWNKGKLTDDAIKNFLDSKATYAGSTVHFLSNEFDFGSVQGRCFEKIRKEDTVDSLYKRLKMKENELYIDALARLSKEDGFNILVLGSNGREHALAVSYAKSKKVKKVIMVPGNGLTDFKNSKIKNYPKTEMTDFDKIVEICRKEKIDLVDVGHDALLASGFVDKFMSLGISAFGPTQKAAQLEWDKEWARNFMVKYGLPIPKFKVFTNKKKAVDYINSLPEQVLFVKAAGLALGKGVIRADNKKEAVEAVEAMSNFGKSGETFLIEEALLGEEFSLFSICDGKNFQVVRAAQDHKRVYDGDQGPNTGGMGAVSPTSAINDSDIRTIKQQIIRPMIEGMNKEGRSYKGILYLGGMKTKDGVKIIEFNSRWGDPEAQTILPSIQTDYLTIALSVINQQLTELKIKTDKKIRLCIAGSSKGYPGNSSAAKGKEIFGLINAMNLPDITFFGSGIKRKGNRFFVNGGRVFHIVGEGKNILEAKNKAYKAMEMISIDGDNLHYRTDIGWRDLERLNK